MAKANKHVSHTKKKVQQNRYIRFVRSISSSYMNCVMSPMNKPYRTNRVMNFFCCIQMVLFINLFALFIRKPMLFWKKLHVCSVQKVFRVTMQFNFKQFAHENNLTINEFNDFLK